MKTTEGLSLLFLLFQALSPSTSADDYTPTNTILLNCGGSLELTDRENRTWIPDVKSKFFSSRDSTASPAATRDPSIPEAPYMTARIFRSPFTYSLPIAAAGRMFVRLYFHPNTYDGLNATVSLLSVSLGPFSLLKKFSASQTAQVLNHSSIVKEFVVNVEAGNLSMTFIPESAYAFVNGIEVTSMPDLYSNTDGTSKLVGSSGAVTIDKYTALENVYRINVGGRDISPSHDTQGLYRSWYEDSPYIFGALFGLAAKAEPNMQISYPRGSPKSVAPADVYSTARTMTATSELNLQFNLTWVFRVDSRFSYLVRLHFCEIFPNINKINQRVFTIYLNNITAELKADVVGWTGGIGVAWHKDYVVSLPNGKEGLWISLHPNEKENPDYYDSILNGVEIFKVNGSNGNLAGPNPTPGPRVLSNPSKVRRVRHGPKNMLYVAVALALAVLGLVGSCLIISKCRRKERASHVTGCRQFSFAEIKEATKNFDESRVLGSGGFGKVYRGEIEGGKVAIKRATPQSEQGVREFKTEIHMLSKLRHRHLVSLIGFCDENGEMILVYDYMAHGTMREHLYKTKNAPLPWKQRLEICIGAARGLHYLHTGAKHMIIHRDVKTTNILLDENWVAKFSDFGLARTDLSLAQTHEIYSGVKGTIGYLDPEYYRHHQLTEKSDVYSFGVVLLEAICARPPLDVTLAEEQMNLSEWAANCYKKGMLDQIVDPFLKGKITPECFKKFAETTMKCGRDEGIERPSTGEVLWNLESALQLQGMDMDDDNCKGKNNDKGSDVHEGSDSRNSGIVESIGGRSLAIEDFDGLTLSDVFSQIIKS